MKKLLSNHLAILGEIVFLVLSLIWYLQEAGMEPLIGIIASFMALITSLFLKISAPNLRMDLTNFSKGRTQERVSQSSRNPRDNK